MAHLERRRRLEDMLRAMLAGDLEVANDHATWHWVLPLTLMITAFDEPGPH